MKSSFATGLLGIGVIALVGCKAKAHEPDKAAAATAPAKAEAAKPLPPPVAAPEWLAPISSIQSETLEDVCPAPDDPDSDDEICKIEAIAGATPRGAILDVKLVREGERSEGTDCFLLIHTKAGWGKSDALGLCGSGPDDSGEVEVELSWLDDAVLLARTKFHSTSRNDDSDGKWDAVTKGEGFMLCGVGASGEPSCTPHVTTAERVTTADAGTKANQDVLSDWTAKVDFQPGAIVAIKPFKAPTDELAPDLKPGTYQVSFP